LKHFVQASNSFTEQVLALAVIDLPFKDQAIITSNFVPEENKVKISASTPAIVFHRNLKVIVQKRKGNQLLRITCTHH
jgi:hypothetical protein